MKIMPEETPRKPHEQDILIVCNPDVNCDVIDTEEDYPHKDYFMVRYSGQPHRIAPGQTRKMPRFLAEHYAKHLANHLLMKMELETGRKGLVQSSFERPKMLTKILLGVDSYFLSESEDEEGEKIAKEVETLNMPEERTIDLGVVPNPMLGVLKPEPVTLPDSDTPLVPDSPPSTAKTSIYDDSKPKPTRAELFAEAEKLGIEVKGNEKVDELIAKIKSF